MKYNPANIEELQIGINFKNLENTPVKDLFLFLRDINVSDKNKKIIKNYFCTRLSEKKLPTKKELEILVNDFAGYGAIGTACLFMVVMAKQKSSKVDSVKLFWEKVKSCRPERSFEIERIIFQKEVLNCAQHLYEKARNNPNSFISKISFFTVLKNKIRVSFPEPKKVPRCVFRRIRPIKPFRQTFFNRKDINSTRRVSA
jgi:hypothetical protein